MTDEEMYPARKEAKEALDGADSYLAWAQRLAPSLRLATYDVHLRIAAALLMAHEGAEP